MAAAWTNEGYQVIHYFLRFKKSYSFWEVETALTDL